MKYLKRFSVNEGIKVRFYDKNGKWFSSGELNRVNDHKKRFGDEITFSVDGIEKEFKTLDEYRDYIRSGMVMTSNIFGNAEEARNRVAEKRKKRLYKESVNAQDPDFAIIKIKEKYPISKVEEMFKEEKEEWIPEDENELWYDENNNGEAQDVIVDQLIWWFEENFYALSDDNSNKLRLLIQKHYSILSI